MATALVIAIVITSGCGQSGSAPTKSEKKISSGDSQVASVAKDSSEPSGWWCNEHGVPETECALCNSKVAAEFQKKGDWCKEHDRPESQCFKCHPELEAKFAALYEAKFGKKPPKPE